MHRCGDGISLKFKMKGERKRMILYDAYKRNDATCQERI